MPRRSYDHYCAISRALDVIGERWALLIVRELCAGPRRYSDLFADMPGISTDVLATRLKDLERDGLIVRRRVGPRSATSRYELSAAGAALRPVLDALSVWGTPLLGERRATDALRGHWFALPLGRQVFAIAEVAGIVEVRIGETVFHLFRHPDGSVTHADGPAEVPDAELRTDLDTATALANGELELADAVREARVTVKGDSALAMALREAGEPAVLTER